MLILYQLNNYWGQILVYEYSEADNVSVYWMKNNHKEAGNPKNWILLLIISTAYIAVFANVQGFKALLPLVQEEFLVSRAQVGLYTSFYFLSAVFIAVFSGRIADYLGTKRGLVLGVGVVAFMILLHSFSPLFGIILVLAFFTGTAFSVITPSVNKGVIELSEPSKRSFSMGIVHGGGGLGGVLGAVMLPFLGEMLGWRTALIFGSVFAAMVTFFILKFYQPPEIREEKATASPEIKTGSLKEDLLALIKNRYLLSVFTMGIVFGMSISSVTGHFPLYLTRDLGTSAAFAGLGLGTFHIGGVAGQPVWGLINERVFHGDRRKGLFLLGMLISALALFFGLVVSRFYFPPYAILSFSFLFGFCTMGVIAIYFTAVSELVSKEYIGVVTGLALIFPRTSTVITPPIFGLIADLSDAYANSWIILGIIVLIFSVGFFYFSGRYSTIS